MFRSRSWFGGSLWKNKNPHSLEHLKYLYNVLSKNNIVTENNRSLLVETLRSIAEILIWGDQNDSSVFDFFLEKNMLSFFLKILKQKCGSYVCVQLLQTLNILFENIRNETSLYYLLSNNHVNSIIVHKFDFSDEEIMAYYISFLKTLSLKLNGHTIHFFYNDHTNDFPLYTEAIKFFKHPESMVRIAVRTLTLNVYRVRDSSMLRFIRNKTAVPYFSNLVWFIGNHVIELETCVRNDADHSCQGRLADLVAEHLDHLHYLNDILCLNIEELNDVLVDHLLNKLFIPLYIYSLLPGQVSSNKERPRVSVVVSLFLLSQVFLITRQEPLVHVLCQILLRGTLQGSVDFNNLTHVFIAPPRSLEESLDSSLTPSSDTCEDFAGVTNLSITDEEKEQILALEAAPKVFLDVIMNSLDCTENDYTTLFSLCLLYAMSSNTGIGNELLSGLLSPSSNHDIKLRYNSNLVQKLINIISLSCQPNCHVRLVTLELSSVLLLRLVLVDDTVLLSDTHLNLIIAAKEESVNLLRHYYKREEIFGDMFESEDEEYRKKPLNVEWLMMDSNVLLPPTVTPLTGIDFNKRLPCGEVERARRAIRVFLSIRRLCHMLTNEEEMQLPLTNRSLCVQNDDVLDLTNSDLLSCYVVGPDGVKNHRFLVVEDSQIILVVPVQGLLGYGQPKLSALLHDIEVTGDKQDSRSLFISAKFTTMGPLVNSKFIFDDAIRCMAAQQRLSKGRMKARDEKMRKIERLLDIPVTDTPPFNLLHQLRHHHKSHGSRTVFPHRLSSYSTPTRVISSSPSRSGGSDKEGNSESAQPNSGKKWRDTGSSGNSPKLPRPRSEEIQLEHMSKRNSKGEEKLPAVGESVPSSSQLSSDQSNKETSFTQVPSDQIQQSKWKVETV